MEILINDRNVFEWEWHGHRLVGAVHADDMLLAVSSLEIQDELMRRIRAVFEVTGWEEEAAEFFGLEIIDHARLGRPPCLPETNDLRAPASDP